MDRRSRQLVVLLIAIHQPPASVHLREFFFSFSILPPPTVTTGRSYLLSMSFGDLTQVPAPCSMSAVDFHIVM
jgi:hypothetical protein